MKQNCYMDISIDGEKNPAPERIRDIMMERYVYIMLGDSMILSEPDVTHMFKIEEMARYFNAPLLVPDSKAALDSRLKVFRPVV